MLGAGMSEQAILGEFPYLEKENIPAALQFAAARTASPVLRVRPLDHDSA